MVRVATAFASPSYLPTRSTPLHALTAKRRAQPRVRAPRAALTPVQQNALLAASIPALPIMAYSEYVLLTTGCGLPPGPGGLLGAAEGISYLVVVALAALSVREKVTTGSGLPPGPAGLLGAAEGMAFLLILAGVADAAYIFAKFGSIPNAVPAAGSRCYPVE